MKHFEKWWAKKDGAVRWGGYMGASNRLNSALPGLVLLPAVGFDWMKPTKFLDGSSYPFYYWKCSWEIHLLFLYWSFVVSRTRTWGLGG